jgi:hypothetical protein
MAIVVAALAYWTGLGALVASATVGTLPTPTITGATTGPESVTLSWSAVTPPGSGTVTYYVSRDGLPPSGGCPNSGSPSTATSCTDGPVPVGPHTYTVTALWRTWTARSEQKSVTVTSGNATHLVLEAASVTPRAGEADSLTVVAKDVNNRTVTSYSGSHALTFEGAAAALTGTQPTVSGEGGSAVAFGQPTAIKFNEGTAIVSGVTNGVMRLYRAEETHIKVREGSLNNGEGLAVKVGPGPFSSFAVATPPGEPEAGNPLFRVSLTAWDEWHNTITSYARTNKLRYEGAESSPSGKAPEYSTTTEPAFTNGVATVTGFKLYKAGETTLKVTEEVTGHSGSGTFYLKPGEAKSLKVSAPTPGEPAAGSPFGVTLSALDSWGNVATGYGGVAGEAKTVAYSGPETSPNGKAPEYPASATSVTFKEGVGNASAITLYKAAATTLAAKAGALEGAVGFRVKPGEAASFRVSAPTPGEPEAGQALSVTLTALDVGGNLATAYGGAAGEAKTIAFSGPEASPSGKAPEYPASVTFKEGVGTATAIKLFKAGANTLTAKEGTREGSTTFTIKVGPFKGFGVTPNPAAPEAGAAFEVKLTAWDEWHNPVSGYAGTNKLKYEGAESSPSGKAPEYSTNTTPTFVAGQASIAGFKFYKAAATTLKVTEEVSGHTGSATFTVKSAEAKSFKLAAPVPAEPEAGQAFNLTITAFDSWGNVATAYGGAAGEAKTIAFSGPEASPSAKAPEYPASVTFKEGVGTATAIKLFKAGAATLTAKEGTREGSVAFTVKFGPFKSFAVVPNPAEPQVGVAFEVKLTAWDEWHNVVTSYTRTNKLRYEGAESSPSGVAPEYSTTTEPAFTNGVAAVTGFKLYKAAVTTLKVTEEVTAHAGSATFTVKPEPGSSLTATTGHFAWARVTLSEGTVPSPCLFTCEVGEFPRGGGTFSAHVAVTDQYGNVVENIGPGHEVKVDVETTGRGTISGAELQIPSQGPAESTGVVTFSSPSKGGGSSTLTARAGAGTAFNPAKAKLHF